MLDLQVTLQLLICVTTLSRPKENSPSLSFSVCFSSACRRSPVIDERRAARSHADESADYLDDRRVFDLTGSAGSPSNRAHPASPPAAIERSKTRPRAISGAISIARCNVLPKYSITLALRGALHNYETLPAPRALPPPPLPLPPPPVSRVPGGNWRVVCGESCVIASAAIGEAAQRSGNKDAIARTSSSFFGHAIARRRVPEGYPRPRQGEIH